MDRITTGREMVGEVGSRGDSCHFLPSEPLLSLVVILFTPTLRPSDSGISLPHPTGSYPFHLHPLSSVAFPRARSRFNRLDSASSEHYRKYSVDTFFPCSLISACPQYTNRPACLLCFHHCHCHYLCPSSIISLTSTLLVSRQTFVSCWDG